MKKALKRAFFVALLKPLLVFGCSAYPGILPSNPFYFTKESFRNLRRALTFNPVSRADLELRIVEQNSVFENSKFKLLELVKKDILCKTKIVTA